jgi:hypothetical protein
MIFQITLINSYGLTREHTVDLPITDQATWEAALVLPQIKLMIQDDWQVLDISPDGMTNLASEEERLALQKTLV